MTAEKDTSVMVLTALLHSLLRSQACSGYNKNFFAQLQSQATTVPLASHTLCPLKNESHPIPSYGLPAIQDTLYIQGTATTPIMPSNPM